MSTRDKSDFGSGKILPEELHDGAAPAHADEAGGVHPERDWATGPDIAAAEGAGHGPDDSAQEGAAGTDGDQEAHRRVEQGAHFRDDPLTRTDAPVELPHAPKHGAADD